MRVDAEKNGAPQWAVAKDDRVTRVGSLIRRFRIDEFPQLLNVLKGEMSLVGPRPERPFFVEQLTADIPFYAVRHSVKPGVTGWAQVRYQYGASVEDSLQKLQYDLYYVKNHSLLLDILVLFETDRRRAVRQGRALTRESPVTRGGCRPHPGSRIERPMHARALNCRPGAPC